jgi:hypothetical protein
MKDNKLIAEFMGAKPIVLGNSTEYEMYGVVECINDGVDEKHFFIADEMDYHTSWDWLMPVVEKIMTMSFEEDADVEDFYSIRDCIPNIGQTYRAVVEFIREEK